MLPEQRARSRVHEVGRGDRLHEEFEATRSLSPGGTELRMENVSG